MSERMDGWRECADPVELAAAVAAGVEVQRNWGYGWQPGTNNETAEQFAGCTKANLAYRVPASWSWSPEPPADVPTGAERYLAERLADPEYRAAYEAAAPVTGDDLRERIARAIYADDVENERTDFREGVAPCYYDNADAVLAVLPAPPRTATDERPACAARVARTTREERTMSEEREGWRECADPVELAAAVAAGVEVLCVAVNGRTWETGCEDSESFRRCMADDCRYRVPASWSWSPEPPAPVTGDDLRERIARAIWEDDERVKRDQLNDWRAEPLTDHEVYLRNADAVLAVLPPQPAPSPVPPWPGAVLSGLCDEDGVPTWLAQAGQVRGEQVRLRHLDDEWATWATLDGDEWVEVRAPRAVPVPETERVPWGEALIGRSVPGRPELVDYIRRTPDGIHRFGSLLGGGKWEQTASADGTVEVLARDGES